MYLRAAKTAAEEEGLITDGMATSVSKLRDELFALTNGKVDIQIDEDNFKSTYEILKELSGVWNELTAVSYTHLDVYKRQVRNLAPSVQGTDSHSDIYNLGYYGKFYGSPVIVTPQRHKVGTTDFVMADDVINIIAGDDKPIKCVYEGDPIVIMGDATSNGDLTHEYLYGEKYGMGIVLAGGNSGIGRYEIA